MDRLLAIGIAFTFGSLLFSCGAQNKPATKPAAMATPVPTSLTGTEWTLADLAGNAVAANSKASIAFPEVGRVAGNASCNRYTGSVTISGESIKFGPAATTRMACISDAMNQQEMQFLKALNAATHFEVKGGELLIYADGFEKPLRFVKASSSTP